MRIAVAALLAGSIALPGIATAQDMMKTVEARQGYYKLLEANVGPLFGMAKGGIDYDAATAQTYADNLATLTNYNLGHLFAPGTSRDDLGDVTRAKGDIWENFPDVGAKGAAFVEAVLALQVVAGDGVEAMGAALPAVGGACAACHDDYRAK